MIPVAVPTAEVASDERRPDLDQTPREQRALSPGVSTVAVSQTRVFCGNVERFTSARSELCRLGSFDLRPIDTECFTERLAPAFSSETL